MRGNGADDDKGKVNVGGGSEGEEGRESRKRDMHPLKTQTSYLSPLALCTALPFHAPFYVLFF